MKKIYRISVILLVIIMGLWLVGEIGTRLYLEAPLEADFYSSIPRQSVKERQAEVGVQVATGPGWAHLGWIADPENEEYVIITFSGDILEEVGVAQYGSFLVRKPGNYMVASRKNKDAPYYPVGQAVVDILPPMRGEEDQAYQPRIAGEWQTLFRPEQNGDYINDHSVYQDAQGDWRLVGITAFGEGDFNAERYFAVGVSADFPPSGGMQEAEPIADFGTLAWAPHVITTKSGGQPRYHMFWSPHELHQMDSADGITWENHRVSMPAPAHKFFRDPMVVQVAPNQWLLYTTARGAYYSQVDIYQSFDLQNWQYIRSALQGGWGSERNAPFASMESPFLTQSKGQYYLSLTYNNDSFFWGGILMLGKIWLDRPSYNDTLVFHADNPYDFGTYQGRGRSDNLVAQLEAHAPEIIYHPEQDTWYITTAGWPWVASLTSGEVAVARLEWEPIP